MDQSIVSGDSELVVVVGREKHARLAEGAQRLPLINPKPGVYHMPNSRATAWGWGLVTSFGYLQSHDAVFGQSDEFKSGIVLQRAHDMERTDYACHSIAVRLGVIHSLPVVLARLYTVHMLCETR